MSKVVVYDIETLASCYTYTDIDINTSEIKQFVIHKDKNELSEMVAHLKSLDGMIGFNNIGFDYPVIHDILTSYNDWLDLTNQEIIDVIYRKAQYVISEQNKPYASSTIRDKDVIIKQLDLFRIWHFNNKARMTSLKSLEIAMNYPNVMDMPIHHDKTDITIEEVDGILKYNLNDVLATYEFYKKSLDKINLRKDLFKKYNINCINYSDSKIGEQLVLKLYCEASKLNIWDVKKLRTEREIIHIKDCLLPYIKFQTKDFNNLLDMFKSKSVVETKGAIEESVIYKGFKYDYGLGGIHGCIKPGIYESNDDYLIIDADVGSLYPSIAVLNGFYPEHLGKEFCKVYEGILKQRLVAKKAGNMSISDALKLSLNSVYGKSNDKFSFLYDPMYTMKTTLNGQLMLTMLIEDLVENIDLQMLQVNTDGITVKIKKTDLELYYLICKEWEAYTKLTLEYVEYSKMVIRDVKLAS